MNFIKVIVLSICCIAGAAHAAKSCFIASHDHHTIVKEGDCETRHSPCSTFKIAISLMGYDSGILIDETHPTWKFKPGYIDWLAKWKQPHNPTQWLTNSCVWYSQVVTKRLGLPRFAKYTKRLNYGNQDVSGDKGQHNGLTHCWLSSSLTISPAEQIQFLEQLVDQRLPVSVKAQVMTKHIMFIENLPNGWKLYGKTGSGSQLDAKGRKRKDRQIGWFIGFVEKGEDVITFAYFIADDKPHHTFASVRAKAALHKRIGALVSRYD